MKPIASFRCQKQLTGLAVQFLCVSALLAASAMRAMPQEAPPQALAPGVPAGSYALSDVDTINLFNGRVNVHLPLFNLAGRAGRSRQLSFTIDAPAPWKVTDSFDANGNPFSYVEPGMSSDGVHTSSYAMRSESSGTGAQQCWTGYPEEYWKWTTTITRIYLIEPNGTEHEMRDAAFNGQPLADSPNNCPLGPFFAGPSRGKIFESTDGFGATLIFADNVRDGIRMDSPWPVGGGAGWLLFKDGRRMGIADLDRNGNKIDFTVAGQYPEAMMVDSLNQTINWEGQIDAAACAALVGGSPYGCVGYSKKGSGGTLRKIWIAYDQDQHATVILLPNNQRYSFSYNQYGDVTRIDLPTGGSIEYDYEAGLVGSESFCGSPPIQGCIPGTYSDFVYRRVVARRVYREGHVLESRQTFSKPGNTNGSNAGYVEKKQYDANDHLLSSERHFFYGTAEASFSVKGVDYVPWRSGREYRTEFYGGLGNLLRTTETIWAERDGGVAWWTGNQDDAPQNDPRVVTAVNHLENGLSRTTGFGYDPTVPYNSLTDVYHYDYDGTLLRHTHTDYLKNLNGVDYTGSNIQSGSEMHMRDFPVQVSVFDATREFSRTSYEYDNYNTDSNHAGLVPRPNISGLDASFTTSYLTRGNVTGTTSYLIESGIVVGSVSSYAQYDVAGNVVKAIDPRGFATNLYYDDHFGAPDGEVHGNTVPSELSTPGQLSFAFVTKAMNAAGHTAYSQFDYYLGKVIDTEDANGVVTSTYFNDVLDRPTQLINAVNKGAPIKNQSTFGYDDANRVVVSTRDLSSYNDNLLKGETLYDGLGRIIESRSYETGSQFIAVRMIPFTVMQDPDTNLWVQATRSSNPFRSSEQPVWTTTFVDSLGRMSKVLTPDNAILRAAYNGNRVLTTDQDEVGKQRLRSTNALGEITDVWEITGADSETEALSFPGHPEVAAGYRTSYEFDALGNLSKVTQGTQTPRTFAYDSFRQVKSATSPESGAISYQYDENGNITVKTDARGVSTHFSYDQINRVKRRWYNASSQTSATNNDLNLPNGAVGTAEAAFIYDSQALPGGAPSFTRGAPTGRLVASTYGTGGSNGDYFSYDDAGRPMIKIQQSGGLNYQVTASYNVSDRLISLGYPSNHAVSYNYDGAGRTLSVVGNIGDATQRNYSTGTVYSPWGSLAKEQFGTDIPIFNKLFYTSRGQLAEIRESTGYTGPTDTTWNRGAIINHYGNYCWGMCGGGSMTDNNGDLKKQEVYVPLNDQLQNAPHTTWWQRYDYDKLNRLQRVHEFTGNLQTDWQQEYIYDRYGNRKLHQTNTYGVGINKKDFTVIPENNRLGVPAGQTGTMTYDFAGNLVTDTYSALAVTRGYDADNRMTSETQANSYVAGAYIYDATGKRVKRTINGVETWQVYGFGGEVMAEYVLNAGVPTLQKEYGYRNGQLLVTAGTGAATASPPSTLVAGPSSGGGNVVLTWSAASGAGNYRVERKGATGSFVLDGITASTALTDTGVSAGTAYLYRVCAANAQGNCTSVFSNIALGAAVSFPTDPTITSSVDDPTGVNVTKVKAAHIMELRAAVNAVRTLAGLASAQWTNQTLTARVAFISADDVRDLRTKLNDALVVLGIQTSNYDDQTLAGAPNGTVIKKVHITQLRQRSTSGTGGPGGSSSNQFGVQWLVADQLGTPRMVFDQTGNLANVKRHDYLPFGEETLAGVRGTTPGYGLEDGVRQKFTGYEHDGETGLEFAQARHHSTIQGRFTSPDPLLLGARPHQPQSWNRYSYVANNPLKYVDPLGLQYFVGGGTAETNDEPEIEFPDDLDVIVITVNWPKNKPGVPSIFDAEGGVAAFETTGPEDTPTANNPARGFSHGFSFGPTVGASGAAGFGKIGAGGSLAFSSGVFRDARTGHVSAGNYGSAGAIAGILTPEGGPKGPMEFRKPDVPAQTLATGLFGGAGGGFWFSNAATPQDTSGPFQTTIVNSPMIAVEVDQGDNGIFIVNITKGIGGGNGVLRLPTNTKVLWDSNNPRAGWP